jgi:hypothetical protein
VNLFLDLPPNLVLLLDPHLVLYLYQDLPPPRVPPPTPGGREIRRLIDIAVSVQTTGSRKP